MGQAYDSFLDLGFRVQGLELKVLPSRIWDAFGEASVM